MAARRSVRMVPSAARRSVVVVAVLYLAGPVFPANCIAAQTACTGCRPPLGTIAMLSEGLTGLPGRVLMTRSGDIVVLLAGPGPPLVYDRGGRLKGPLGGCGRGPGESTWPHWIDAAVDDSLRVFELGRVIVFDSALKHARTAIDRAPRRVRSMTSVSASTHAMVADAFNGPEPTYAPIVLRTDTGAVLRMHEYPAGWESADARGARSRP